MAGSSLPVCWRRPNLEFPRGRYDIVEACCLVRGGVSFGFGGDGWHAMEAVQCLLERRHGGETGVITVRYLEGLAVWKARDQGAFSQNLMDAAASYTRIRQGVSLEQAVGVGPDGDDKPALVLVQYRDGLRLAMLLIPGVILPDPTDSTLSSHVTSTTTIGPYLSFASHTVREIHGWNSRLRPSLCTLQLSRCEHRADVLYSTPP